MAEFNTNEITNSKEATLSLAEQGYGVDDPSAIENHPYVTKLRDEEQTVAESEIIQAPSAEKITHIAHTALRAVEAQKNAPQFTTAIVGKSEYVLTDWDKDHLRDS